MNMNDAVEVGAIRAAPGEKMQGYFVIDLPEKNVEVPVTVVNGQERGPRLVVTAGIHGSEYPPIEAAHRFASSLDPEDMKGSVVVVHIANPFAFRRRSIFFSDLEERNLARCFPGSPSGSLTERLACQLFDNLIRPADLFIDLHGGDMIEELIPFTAVVDTPGHPGQVVAAERLAQAFNLGFLNRSRTVGSTYFAAASIGIPAILAEAGGHGLVTESDVKILLRGLNNVLRELGMVPGEVETAGKPVRLKGTSYVRAAVSGLSHLHVSVGEAVSEGQRVATITDPFGESLHEALSPSTGYVLYLTSTLAINGEELLLAIGVTE